MAHRALALACLVLGPASCTLFVPLDDLSDPVAGADGGDEASARDDAELASADGGGAPARDTGAPAPDPNDKCPCPNSLPKVNGICVVSTGSAVGFGCSAPIMPDPKCPLTYEVELCAAQSPFPYAAACGNKARQSVFFQLGSIGPGVAADGGPHMWVVRTTNTEVLSRTNAACTTGVEPCAAGPSPGGDLAANDPIVAIGKTVGTSCSTVRVQIGSY